MKPGLRLFVVVSAFAACHANAVMIRAASSCGNFVADRLLDSTSHQGHMLWIVGFLSGLSAGEGEEFFANGPDNSSISLWMDRYCRANPLNRIDDGATVLYWEVVKKNRAARAK